jgi:hypothetical protein
MFIKSHLFNKGFMTGQPSLFDVLGGHERRIIDTIKSISSLDEMTEAFLSNLVKDSLVEPLEFHFDKQTYQLRTEEFDGAEFPSDFHVYRGKKYPKQVARISIPFSGDPNLLRYTPSTFSGNFPLGQVSGNTVQFDVILWGYQDDERHAKEQIDSNIDRLRQNAQHSAKDVRAFNEALPAKVKAAFNAKLDELTKQHSIFGNLGIKAQEPPAPSFPMPSTPSPQPKKERRQPIQIIQYIEKQYVQQLDQINNNMGDVNNAIQTD